MWAFFAICLVLIVATIATLLRRFAGPTVPAVVHAATAYAWLTSLFIVALVPLDVWTTLSKAPSSLAIDVLWDVSYWSTQALTWLLLPFFQVYSDAGDFTVAARVATSLKENGALYGAAAGAGAVGLVILAVVQRGLHLADLTALGMALSNTFGLCAGILLMGYGLVEIPRSLWRSEPERALKWCCHRAGRYAEQVLKATAELEAVVTIICANERQMPRRDPLRPYMEIISATAEAESPVKPSAVAGRTLDIEALSADDLEYNYDKQGLAALRRRLAAAMHGYRGAHAQYAQVIGRAQELEDMVKCRASGEYGTAAAAHGRGGPGWRGALWRYRCAAEPGVRKLAGAVLLCVSLLVVWCEATIFTGRSPDLSPFSLAIRSARSSEWGVQVLAALPLAYVCICTAFALFRLNAFNFNKLLPKATTGAALMQNGSLMCRFAAPTCWNFLHMIRMDGNVDGEATVFTQNMGTMDVLPVLGRHLNVYLPLLLVVHTALIALNLWDRLLAACVPARYRFSTDDVDDAYTERGRLLIRKEAEAAASGMHVGDLLHSGGAEDIFPSKRPGGVAAAQRAVRGWFAGLRGKNGGGGAPGAGEAELSAPTSRGAAERAPLFSGMRSDVSGDGGGAARPGGSSSSLTQSLVANKHSASPQASDGDAAAAAPHGLGLDGLFAELSSKPAPRRRTGG